MLLPRTEPGIHRRREHIRGNRFLERGHDRPTPLARIVDAPLVAGEKRILDQRDRQKIQQPRADHSAAPPQLGDLSDLQLVPKYSGGSWALLAFFRMSNPSVGSTD